MDSLTFATCGDPAWVRNTHTVTFDGGEVTLTLWLGNNVVATSAGGQPRFYSRVTATPPTSGYPVEGWASAKALSFWGLLDR